MTFLSKQVLLVDVQVATADSPVDETTPSLAKDGKAVALLKDEKLASNCGIR